MKIFLRKFIAGLFFLQISLFPAYGEQASTPKETTQSLNNVRVEGEDIILELSQLVPYDIFTLQSPSRLVVEIPETQYKASFNKKEVETALVKRIRGYQFKENPLISRVILDLKSNVDYKTNTNGNEVIISLKKNDVVEEGGGSETAAPKKVAVTKKGNSTDLLRTLPTEVVTLDFEAADIKDVIRLMAETSNINIIFGPEVSGSISVHLKKVPFDEAFRTILNLKGLVASQLGTNILRVSTPEVLAKERSKAVTFTKSIAINYLKASDMMGHLQAVMTSAGRKGTITVVSETNSLVVTDSEEGIDQAERLVAQLDSKPKQVMIEARIVEINLNNGFDIGVQWEYGAFNNIKTGANGEVNSFNYLGGINNSDGRVKFDYGGNTGRGAIPFAVGGTGVALPGPVNAGINFGFVKNNEILSASLAALINQSRAKVLSAPKVVTVNGQLAKIEAVQDIPFRTSTVSGTGVVSNSFKTVSAGIILTVTPTINAENRITLVIKPESSFPTEQSTEAGPIIRSRNAQTTVIVKDGDTLVIGGLIDDQDTKTVQKVPLLGDIPIIGVFFRTNSTRKIRNELLVFVTPRIIRD